MNELAKQIQKHLVYLAGTLGPRPLGSAANRAAVDYLLDVLQTAGLQVERQGFPCPAWEVFATRLRLGGRELEAWPNPFSPPGQAEGPLAVFATLAELEAADIAGRLVLLHGEPVDGGLATPGAMYHPERDRKVSARLAAAGPAAVLTVNNRPGNCERMFADWTLPFPSATVPPETARVLLQAGAEPVALEIAAESRPAEAANVIARLPGGGDRPKLVLCAHLDTKPGTPGAFDNASGVAVLLALAERWAGRVFPVELEWVFFDGEEFGGVGDTVYAEAYEHNFARVLAAINVDGVGAWLGATSVTQLAGSAAFEAHVRAIAAGFPGVAWVEPWYASDHYTFFSRGVPSLALTSLGGPDITHRAADTVAWIDPLKLAGVAELVAALVEGLQSRPIDWARPGAENRVRERVAG